ncbi:MAG: GNAT family N-acetyltransferase [Bacilli bacterium]|nr:GNAT family N-acetyltransferase [Bacilli bacterium]MDD4406495.1 GNAT family N-acetyltransferase [Bacilli bacterium]
MKYKLKNASEKNLELMIKYKLKNIFEYAINLSAEEIEKINNYVNDNIPKQIKNYKLIYANDEIVGALLVLKHLDGVLIDEIHLDEDYRNKKIGSSIILNILNSNKIVYLWVYKNNKKGIKLYKKLGFNIIEETINRYFMEFNNK